MRIALTDMVIGDIIGNVKINCGILPNPRYRGPHSRSVAVVGARRGARQEANRGPRARCSKAFSAGSMTPTTPFRLNERVEGLGVFGPPAPRSPQPVAAGARQGTARGPQSAT